MSRLQHIVALFDAFDELRPGDGMVAVTDHPPRKLLNHLQANRRGLFEWFPLESGPEIWRTEVTRRDATPGSVRGICEAMAWNRDRLRALLAAAFESRRSGDRKAAALRCAEFAEGMRRHIRIEEEVLFPAHQAHDEAPIAADEIRILSAEHREIEAALECLENRAGLREPAAERLRGDLLRIMERHDPVEMGAHSCLDRRSSDRERKDLMDCLQRVGLEPPSTTAHG
jgi:uncharacterized protein (DUF2249 family)